MKLSFLKLCGLMLVGIVPSITDAADSLPTTNPAATAAPRVEVFAFTSVTADPQLDWIGKGIQENLQSDVSRTSAKLVLPKHTVASTDSAATDDSIAIAKNNRADLAVVGTFQAVGNQVRVNAHLIEVATSNTVAGFSATGSQSDIFKLEDALGEQFRHLLPGGSETSRDIHLMDAVEIRPWEPVNPQLIQTTNTPATVNNYYQTPASVNGYSPDSYYYPGYYQPLAFNYSGGFGYYNRGLEFRGDNGFHDYNWSPGFINLNPGFQLSTSYRNPVNGRGIIGGFTGNSFGRTNGFVRGSFGGGLHAGLGGGRR